MARSKRKIGYAVLGIGDIAQEAVLPAFAHAEQNSKLIAIVSSDAHKRQVVGRRYGVDAYDSSDVQHVLQRDDVDALYVCTPNTAHTESVLLAARHGVHVIVEKPMATAAVECARMVRACARHDVKLMVAYRLHFEPANLSALKIARSRLLGDLRFFSSEFSYQLRSDNIRGSAALGGGAIWDLGPYCVNAARTFFRAEPVEVMAVEIKGHDRRFDAVPEGWSVVLRFPKDRTATFTCSFGAATTGSYRLVGTRGDLRLDNAYEYAGSRHQTVVVDGKPRRRTFEQTDHFAPELLYFSSCVLNDRQPEPSGAEGLADVRILQAALRAGRSGKRVRLVRMPRVSHPSPQQLIVRPRVVEPQLVDAAPAPR